ncbi:MAG: type II CRISPR RNA-guided endonuclease Cas9 [Planctomycetaceae bacterium]|nr:type II CRISPR RNA-guided endonuclease Cas9 [Planctomycetaceae bacterium]
MTHVTLGLDIGPNSIGWALIDEEEPSIVDLGVRVFPEGVDNFDTRKEKSRNEDRRIARGMRRQIARRSRRKRHLRDALITAGLWPSHESEQEALLQTNPYELRAKALGKKLTPHEIGRVFLHLNQRRGFLSNRKKDRGDSEVKGMLAEMSELAQAIEEAGLETLGQYLFQKCESFDHAQRTEDDHIRNRHTRRNMLEDEFEKIWDAQAEHHPQLLSEQLRYGSLGKGAYPFKPRRKPDEQTGLEAFGIHGMIFFQRKMYWPKSVVGLCELEPKEKRCPRADRHAQRFRLLQEVNNLRYIDPDTHEECKLDEDQRTLLLEYLGTREKATFDQIRKHLGFLESVKFNLERGKRPSLKGMTVDWLMAKATGKGWHKLPDDQKDSIARMLVDNEREDDAIESRLISEFDWTSEQADAALDVEFPPGYGSLSLKAIDKLLPHLEQGLVYQSVSDPAQSALHAAGYLRRDELQRRLFDELPDPTRVNLRECRIGDIPNPVVKRALVELRKVVNAIIREYGKPDEVHVEMARSIQMGPQARSDYNSRMRENEKDRDNAANEIRAYRKSDSSSGVRVNRDSILRYLLWDHQGHECVYCQKTISQKHLFGGEVDVDHIFPYSRCLDDSQANKVVVHRTCNHDKGQRTPYEWLADSEPDRYARVCQHVSSLMHQGKMRYGKYRKFLQKELDLDKFIARQLTDTGYIASATAEYLRCLFESDHDVLGLKGQHTAELRRQWGLNSVLRNDDLDLKNREDHRHHAVDALIAALTDRRMLQKLAWGTSEVQHVDRETGDVSHKQMYRGRNIDAPWEDFRDEVVERVNQINVSHRPERKVAGALHEETIYGPTPEPGVFVVRKPLESLSPNEIPLIRDDGIRAAIEARLAEHGIKVGRGKKVDSKQWKQALCDQNHPVLLPPSRKRLKREPDAQGIPIKKVRVLRRELTIQPIRANRDDEAYVKPGSTHHLAIFEWAVDGKTKRDAVFVTQLEAINRIKDRVEIIHRHPPKEHPIIPINASFVMSLSRGEMIILDIDGKDELFVFVTAASTTRQMTFYPHASSKQEGKQHGKLTKYPGSLFALNPRKVTVDPLGRIRWAND